MSRLEDAIAFSFRLPEDLKEAFQKTCEARDRSMSQELREMVRAYVRRHSEERQHEMMEMLEEADV
ncbi:ribbon-helix-helix protein, CopG family [Salinibacter ruber]|jgi:predicted transcriptional regulator|uniref:ribbon-helix-helix protein, CopG family n=1 Tax=Salinibacter ruber TaxID=146919 RepID=UPI000C9ED695|nr:ribbon-helix-helix protein, CopG family [Salinibacter ruber]MCS4201920.1 putative transcriptional regulator [Salinibacter ruber]